MARLSAGILLYRHHGERLEVLLAHPGGPFWRHRDLGAWTIPKGEVEAQETLIEAARREFLEETGYDPAGEMRDLGEARQPSGKHLKVWALHGDWDPSSLVSSTFTQEWPRKSGITQVFPEIDRAEWFAISMAKQKISPGQAVFLDRLQAIAG